MANDKRSCWGLKNDWTKLAREEMSCTSKRRKIENKLDRGRKLTRADRDRLSMARSCENRLGRRMLELIKQMGQQRCIPPSGPPDLPPRRRGHALAARRITRQDVFARQNCDPQCRALADKATAADERGDKKKAEFYGNRYWRCVRSCFSTRLPRSRRKS